MLNVRIIRLLKAILLGGFMLVGVNFGHIITANSYAMGGMVMGHSTSGTQCQSICTSSIKTSIQDVLTIIQIAEQEPKPLTLYAGIAGFSVIAGIFIVKRLFGQSSWRPPDLTKLQSKYLVYA